MKKIVMLFMATTLLFSCSTNTKKEAKENTKMEVNPEIKKKADEFVSFKLTTDLSVLSENEKQMLPILLEAAKLMNDIYWQEAYGNKDELLSQDWDKYTLKFIKLNYGPWERLNANKPFLPGYDQKPAGANFYPKDMTKEEFEAWTTKQKQVCIP